MFLPGYSAYNEFSFMSFWKSVWKPTQAGIAATSVLLLFGALLAMSAAMVPVVTEFQQKSFDNRSEASSCSNPAYPNGCSTSCTNGASFQDDCPAGGAFSSCGAWAQQACSSVGASVGSAPANNNQNNDDQQKSQNSNVCAPGSASGCTGQPYGHTFELGGSCMECTKQAGGTCGRNYTDQSRCSSLSQDNNQTASQQNTNNQQTAKDTVSPDQCNTWCGACGGFCGDEGVRNGETCNQQAAKRCPDEQPCYLTNTCDTCEYGVDSTRCNGTTLQACTPDNVWLTQETNSSKCTQEDELIDALKEQNNSVECIANVNGTCKELTGSSTCNINQPHYDSITQCEEDNLIAAQKERNNSIECIAIVNGSCRTLSGASACNINQPHYDSLRECEITANQDSSEDSDPGPNLCYAVTSRCQNATEINCALSDSFMVGEDPINAKLRCQNRAEELGRAVIQNLTCYNINNSCEPNLEKYYTCGPDYLFVDQTECFDQLTDQNLGDLKEQQAQDNANYTCFANTENPCEQLRGRANCQAHQPNYSSWESCILAESHQAASDTETDPQGGYQDFQSDIRTQQCKSDKEIYDERLPNSVLCSDNGTERFQCAQQFHNDNGRCVPDNDLEEALAAPEVSGQACFEWNSDTNSCSRHFIYGDNVNCPNLGFYDDRDECNNSNETSSIATQILNTWQNIQDGFNNWLNTAESVNYPCYEIDVDNQTCSQSLHNIDMDVARAGNYCSSIGLYEFNEYSTCTSDLEIILATPTTPVPTQALDAPDQDDDLPTQRLETCYLPNIETGTCEAWRGTVNADFDCHETNMGGRFNSGERELCQAAAQAGLESYSAYLNRGTDFGQVSANASPSCPSYNPGIMDPLIPELSPGQTCEYPACNCTGESGQLQVVTCQHTCEANTEICWSTDCSQSGTDICNWPDHKTQEQCFPNQNNNPAPDPTDSADSTDTGSDSADDALQEDTDPVDSDTQDSDSEVKSSNSWSQLAQNVISQITQFISNPQLTDTGTSQDSCSGPQDDSCPDGQTCIGQFVSGVGTIYSCETVTSTDLPSPDNSASDQSGASNDQQPNDTPRPPNYQAIEEPYYCQVNQPDYLERIPGSVACTEYGTGYQRFECPSQFHNQNGECVPNDDLAAVLAAVNADDKLGTACYQKVDGQCERHFIYEPNANCLELGYYQLLSQCENPGISGPADQTGAQTRVCWQNNNQGNCTKVTHIGNNPQCNPGEFDDKGECQSYSVPPVIVAACDQARDSQTTDITSIYLCTDPDGCICTDDYQKEIVCGSFCSSKADPLTIGNFINTALNIPTTAWDTLANSFNQLLEQAGPNEPEPVDPQPIQPPPPTTQTPVNPPPLDNNDTTDTVEPGDDGFDFATANQDDEPQNCPSSRLQNNRLSTGQVCNYDLCQCGPDVTAITDIVTCGETCNPSCYDEYCSKTPENCTTQSLEDIRRWQTTCINTDRLDVAP